MYSPGPFGKLGVQARRHDHPVYGRGNGIHGTLDEETILAIPNCLGNPPTAVATTGSQTKGLREPPWASLAQRWQRHEIQLRKNLPLGIPAMTEICRDVRISLAPRLCRGHLRPRPGDKEPDIMAPLAEARTASAVILQPFPSSTIPTWPTVKVPPRS